MFNPLPDDKILDGSKFKQSADDNFKFDENSRKFFKWVENTVGKGEIARYKQFLKRLVSQGRQKVSLCGNGLNLCWKRAKWLLPTFSPFYMYFFRRQFQQFYKNLIYRLQMLTIWTSP